MPFRRKHRNSLTSSTSSGGKENASSASVLGKGTEPRLLRCHSDHTPQSLCCELNVNTVDHRRNQNLPRSLSNKERISNLQELNIALVKEVSTLRASDCSMRADLQNLRGELQDRTSLADTLIQKTSHLEEAEAEMAQKLEEERRMKIFVEDRFESVSQMLENLHNANAKLAEEAAHLREDLDHSSAEKTALLEEMEKMLEAKTNLEELIDSIRVSGEAFKAEMQEALARSNSERLILLAENEALLSDKSELQFRNILLANELNHMKEDMKTLRLENSTFHAENEAFLTEKRTLTAELSAMTVKHDEAVEQLKIEKQSMALAREKFLSEKGTMVAEKDELEDAIRQLERERRGLKAERNSLKGEVEQLQNMATMLDKERESMQQELGTYEVEVNCLLQRVKKQQEDLTSMENELHASKRASVLAEKRAKELQDDLYATRSAAAEKEEQAKVNFEKMETETKEAVDGANKRIVVLEHQIAERESSVVELEDKVVSLQADLTAHVEARLALDSAVLEEKNKVEKKQQVLMCTISNLESQLTAALNVAVHARKSLNAETHSKTSLEVLIREKNEEMLNLELKYLSSADMIRSLQAKQNKLEKQLVASVEKQKQAVAAERNARSRLDTMTAVACLNRGDVERVLEKLKSVMLDMQNSAWKGHQWVSSLHAEFSSFMDSQADVSTGKAGGRSKRKKSRSRRNKKVQRSEYPATSQQHSSVGKAYLSTALLLPSA